ncbi:right-handed parallel beta-helix repeat-containing protein [Montanilutibacter psychrotolerans]|uniref:Uncharacterized protein n=1 Tax=Montanilutibacter psychrotolerans TaxID=1327343 RepID=A0A3M8SMQ3_9GAMM|nr:right-handed parallel beta-helix repeat-containing protein [Lysobacter psychrotolerans]RNF82658.1 hypothetical protein EER27_14275 [Lysobacter psychrotolerans]
MTRNTTKSIALILAGLVLLAFNVGAFAQATRTWVSGVGDDVNPCSRTAPCKTFAGAISKTAAGGVINTLDPGGFGAVTITKSITISGGGVAGGGILAAGTNGITVNAGATDVVVIRNLMIDGAKTGINGIRFLAGGSLHVENVEIMGFTNRGIDFTPSGNSQLFVTNSDVHNNVSAASGTGGILIAPTGTGIATVSIDSSRLNDNGFGLRVNTRAIVTISDSVASGNSNFGVASVAASDFSDISVEDCQIANNGAGASVGAGLQADGANATLRISGNFVTNNENGLRAVNSGKILSFGNNEVTDNVTDGNPTGPLTTR